MQSSSNRIFSIAGLILIGLLYGAFGHSYVTSPTSRSNQQQTQTGCRGPACLGPCEVPLSQKTRAAINTQRGASVTVQWPRNNHAGGFIRFAWAPTSQSDNMAVFDANVQQINCHEVGGCAPSDPSNPNGGDTNGGDGRTNPCQTTINVPSNLADGAWTLQWAWFGGAFALGDYYSCVDYVVSGGSPAISSAISPLFVGGDYTYPGQNKCKFFNTNKIHVCLNEPCTTSIFPSQTEQSGPAAGISSSSSGKPSSTSTSGKPASTSTSTSTSTSGKPSSTSTSGKGSTSTGKSSGKTSGKGSSSTSTSTSGKAPSSGSSSSSSSSSGSVVPGGACTIGHMKCLSSETFSTCAHDAWGVSQSCAPGTTCSASGDYIYCL